MGYSGNPDSGITDTNKETLAIVAFVALALYNALELNVIVFSTFRRFKGLYFWSFFAAANGIIPHSIGFLLKNVVGSHGYGLYITLVAVGWVPMVTGQSLVLYSRLHLIFWSDFWLRMILAMIIANVVILHIPIIILMYGANSSPSNSWVHPYVVYEKVQVSAFFLQELIISLVYIKSCFSFFDTQDSLYGDAVREMRRHLILVNVVVILLDIPILCLEYTNFYDMQTAYKALVYSFKLKMEFRILNRLVEMTGSRHGVDPFRSSLSLRIEHASSGSTCQRHL
ncbi:uncharacterized protein UV8b_05820 [Ustilaginoidea virens]|uniref:DUF7703 domain-containing protein n=1 Tax=Ustilaginoidea virens TaxID=1159556 RepID=A0A063C567_USTVR|nr:uncharacterized protein UV8b_05820 [Ustilaginoidea virens]QUC21577.1 hypothetical protein UV8b_05820 [Ustilaginoidea virens]GAO13546.1 hypothetical protein UVI_02015800 [Ustilaginoidea virens]